MTDLVADGWVTPAVLAEHPSDLTGLLYDGAFIHDVMAVHAARFPHAPLI